jgi:hypothetical protein
MEVDLAAAKSFFAAFKIPVLETSAKVLGFNSH